jgi:glyoxylase I family protein
VDAVDHLDLVVTDLERSLAFYRGLLGPLGYVRESAIEGERGERVVYLGRAGHRGGSVSLRAAQSGAHPVPYDRYAVGLHHLAFAAGSRAQVDERAAWASAHGAEIESGPREHDYSPGYYAVFLHDPDGLKLELVHRPAERDLARRIAELEARLAALERPGAA